MNLQAILQYIQDQGHGTIGTDLFREHMPDYQQAVLITSQVPIQIDPYTCLCRGSIQVIARSIDEDLASNKAKQISSALRVSGVDIGDMHIYHMFPRNEPLVYPRSEGDLIEASVNVDISYYQGS